MQIINERVERTVKLADLMQEIGTQTGSYTPVLPQGCRLFAAKNTKTVFVIEQGPTVRTLAWKMEGLEQVKLAFPYIIFIVAFIGPAVHKGYLYYRTKPLTALKDPLYNTNLCNVFDNGEICTGDMRVVGDAPGQKTESYVANFWQSRFNSDLDDRHYRPATNKIPEVSSLERWQSETKQNPLFVLSMPWIHHNETINEVVARLL